MSDAVATVEDVVTEQLTPEQRVMIKQLEERREWLAANPHRVAKRGEIVEWIRGGPCENTSEQMDPVPAVVVNECGDGTTIEVIPLGHTNAYVRVGVPHVEDPQAKIQDVRDSSGAWQHREQHLRMLKMLAAFERKQGR